MHECCPGASVSQAHDGNLQTKYTRLHAPVGIARASAAPRASTTSKMQDTRDQHKMELVVVLPLDRPCVVSVNPCSAFCRVALSRPVSLSTSSNKTLQKRHSKGRAAWADGGGHSARPTVRFLWLQKVREFGVLGLLSVSLWLSRGSRTSVGSLGSRVLYRLYIFDCPPLRQKRCRDGDCDIRNWCRNWRTGTND